MRISLDEPKRSRKKLGRRRHLRTFESSTVQPAAKQQRDAKPTRASGRWRRAQAKPDADPTLGSLTASQRSRMRVTGFRLLAATILVMLVAAIVYVSAAKHFFVYGAEIVGSHYVSLDDIYQEAGMHETNIFWVNPQEATQRIERLDGIRDARVQCGLPARVRIEVEEREPIMLWRVGPRGEGGDWWLDEEGVVLPYHGALTNTVFVIDRSGRRLQPGDRVEPQGIVASVQQLAAALPEVEVYWHQPDRGLSFNQRTSYGEWTVFFGDSRDIARKIEVLQALRAYLASEGIRARYVDIRWPDHPVYGDVSGGVIRGRD